MRRLKLIGIGAGNPDYITVYSGDSHTAIDAIKADCDHNYDPTRQREYDNISFCPDLRDKPAISELLTHSTGRTILDRVLGWHEIGFSLGQIAIR